MALMTTVIHLPLSPFCNLLFGRVRFAKWLFSGRGRFRSGQVVERQPRAAFTGRLPPSPELASFTPMNGFDRVRFARQTTVITEE